MEELGGTRLKAEFEIGLVKNMILYSLFSFPSIVDGRIFPSIRTGNVAASFIIFLTRQEWDKVNPFKKRAILENAVSFIEEHEEAIIYLIMEEHPRHQTSLFGMR
jgi:hypothetical protein